MKDSATIKINFRGGLISPGELYNILVAAGRSGVKAVSFGLRQQLLVEVLREQYQRLVQELHALQVAFEVDADRYPNVCSSYPAEDIFIGNSWLSEGVYKDIFDLFEHRPRLKINISDGNQSFTPILTGNINWVAASGIPHYWHLLVRFPQTNVVYEWNRLVYTNDVAPLSKALEEIIFANEKAFVANANADGHTLFAVLDTAAFLNRIADTPVQLPPFNLPYYEGLNRYQDKYWLGIYRRDELFRTDFLKELCLLCLETTSGQICSTPWKSIIIKNITEAHRNKWAALLAKHQVNMRHAANELNFQVEDNCQAGLALKTFLVRYLHEDDIRSFGVCVGIKTRRRSEVFSNILVRRRALLSVFGLDLFHVYDILCAKHFNPNERTGWAFSRNNFKWLLPEQLRRAILSFHTYQLAQQPVAMERTPTLKAKAAEPLPPGIHFQCGDCRSLYTDDSSGQVLFPAGSNIPTPCVCTVCEAPATAFRAITQQEFENEIAAV